jgi:hypothetical protein
MNRVMPLIMEMDGDGWRWMTHVALILASGGGGRKADEHRPSGYERIVYRLSSIKLEDLRR